MSSNKQHAHHGKSGKKSDDSAKGHSNEKSSSKKTYNQKHYKSSPSISSDKSDCNSSKNDMKPSKGKCLVNAEKNDEKCEFQSLSAQKKNVNQKNTSTETSVNKKDRKNQHSVSLLGQFPTNQLEAKTPIKQTHHSEKFHHGNQQSNCNQTGAKPKNYREPQHFDLKKPANPNLIHAQHRFPNAHNSMRPDSQNIRFQGPRHISQPSYRNFQTPVHQNLKFSQNSTQSEFHKNIRFSGPRQSFQPDGNHHNFQNPVKTTGFSMQQNSSFNFPVHNKQVKCDTPAENPNLSFVKQNSTPFIKQKKKTFPNNQNSKQRKVHKARKRNGPIKSNDIKQKMNDPDNNNAKPILSFQSTNAEPETNFDLIHFSDDDDSVSLSQNSIDNLLSFSDDEPVAVLQPSVNTGNLISICDISLSQPALDSTESEIFSDIESDSDSSEESQESDLTSEFSLDSGILSNETRLNILKPATTMKEAFVSVFWDIENCALPQKKSAVDFASYIRDTFYEGRTEVTFTAACDVSNLNTLLVRDLDDAAITLIHISSLNKNAADKKIMSLLQRFQIQYRKSNSAIVLISSDSDFSQVLLDMRYQHHIFVNLICKNETRDSLTKAANKYLVFEDVVNNLPDQGVKNKMQHVITVTNLPQLKGKQIKNSLSVKLKIFNCKIKLVNAAIAKIFFKDHSVCVKALNSLDGFKLAGNALHISYQKEVEDNEVLSSKEKKKNMKSLDINVGGIKVSKNNISNSEVNKESNSGNSATLCIVVSMHLRDTEYWKSRFEETWKMTDFSIIWDDATFGGGCFLISFKSLKKAQKAKKLLQKNQMNDITAPKFLKLIKHDADLNNLKTFVIDNNQTEIEINRKKIDEHLQIIETKKLTFLKKHENVMNNIKRQVTSEETEANDAIKEKLNECREQIATFISISNAIINNIRKLSYSSENLEQQLKEFLCDFTRECNYFTSALPIYVKKEVILNKMRENQILLVCAEAGSGKSTQLTQYIWNDKKNFKEGKIICTQPGKIAAISLAKHVSSQIGSRLGDIVGYQVGLSKKMSPNTNILYVTDLTMLKILISEDMDSVSCIIIDETHERTIYTDILLGVVKQYLLKYPYLKLVITSTTNDVSVFRNFFSLPDSAVLQIPIRFFPIETKWLDYDVTPDFDYFVKTIDKTFEILTEESGDVLTFLTTPHETEKACEIFSKKLQEINAEINIKLFCLHGKMDSEEQQKVFAKTSKGKRKVVFATNYAEALITIPGIKYVVDCGLVRETKYDAARKMNILSVGFVSRSSAEQRREKAGLSQVGKCYCLYSKRNYSCMKSNDIPEILRINLGQAVLKLLEMGIKDPFQFDYIQSPPRELLTLVKDQLLNLNAVDENFTLTDLGKNMAALPLEPRLGHLIFQGFDNNIGYDTLVTAALVTMSRKIFFSSSDNKDDANEKKKRFCEYGSDFISYLEVYKEWIDVPKALKSQWCVLNCINARTMRTVYEVVNEIILILQKDLNFKINLKFNSETTTTYDTLTKLVFYSFSQNLAVFSGHPKFGFLSSNVSDPLSIHPSSSLTAFDQSLPQFIVYDTILKTTQTFIVNVSPVTKDMILDAVNLHGLNIDLNSLDNLSGTELCIKPVAEQIILRCFVGKKGVKQRELQRKIKELTESNFIEIDVDISKRCIKIFGFGHNFDKIESIIHPIILDAQQFLLNEKRNVYLCENSQFSGILAAGGHINDVVLSGEFRDVKVILKGEESVDSVCDKLRLCGIITADIHDGKNTFRVTFDSPVSAKKALDTYKNETGFLMKAIHKYVPVNKSFSYKVFMSFFRRPCLKVAYISVETNVPFSLPSVITYENVSAKVSISQKTKDIRITDLPVDTDRKKLMSLISTILPSDVKITKCIVPRKKPYVSTTEEIEAIKNNILELFAQFTPKENISIGLKVPTPKDSYWSATIYFQNSLDGETALNILKNRKDVDNFLGGFILKPELNTFLCCKTQIFSALKEEIEEALESLKKKQSSGSVLNIDAIPINSDTVKIKFMSNNFCNITDATKCIHKILSGDEFKFSSNSYKVKLFSNSGKEMLKKLSLEFQDCYILQNEYSKTISMFGKKTSCNILKMRINEFLYSVKDQDLKELSLKTNSGRTGVFKELLRKYGYDLQKLKEDCGVSDVEVNKDKQSVEIQGNASSIAEFESVIQNMKEIVDANSTEVIGERCPMCDDEVSDDNHCLQYCGHLYCIECLLHLLQNSADIPLCCELCKDPVVVADIFWAIKGRKQLEDVLFKRFLHAFVDSRSDISFCPSPDCPMIFRVTLDEMNTFTCPSCRNSICTKCEDFYHLGMTCSLNKILKSDFSSPLEVEIWRNEDPVNHKICPSCSSPIEKNGSCNHMICWKCKCHMCWLCLDIFPTGDEVNHHLSSCLNNNLLLF